MILLEEKKAHTNAYYIYINVYAFNVKLIFRPRDQL